MAAALAMVACNSAKTFTINGELAEGTDVKEIILSNTSTGDVVDTIKVLDGKFSYTGNAETISDMRLRNGRMNASFISEPGEIKVVFGKESTVKGSALNTAMQSFKSESKQLGEAYQEAYNKIKEEAKDDVDAIRAKIEEYYKSEYQPKEAAMIAKVFEANKTNILGTIIFNGYMADDKSIKEIDEFIVSNPSAATYAPLTRARNIKVNQENTAAGKMFTDFTARNIENTADVKLSDYVGKGNYVVVDFWASWCGPCKREMPYIRKVYDAHKAQGLVVLSVNVWDKYDECIKATKELDMVWSHIYASDNKIATDIYGVRGIPTLILFAPDGTIVDRTLRGEALVEKLAEVYKK